MPHKKAPNNCVCLTCSTPFRRSPSVIARGKGKYCKRACRSAAERQEITLTCERCGQLFEQRVWKARKRAFCPTGCRDRYYAESIIVDADGVTARVPLRARGGSIRAWTLIDVVDVGWVGQHRWYLSSSGYAARRDGIQLHREVLRLTYGDGVFGDHRGLDKLDNRRSNLRVLTPEESAQNLPPRTGTSKYRGVSWYKHQRLWAASCSVGGKRVFLAYFKDELEAAEAARAARLRFMPFATN